MYTYPVVIFKNVLDLHDHCEHKIFNNGIKIVFWSHTKNERTNPQTNKNIEGKQYVTIVQSKQDFNIM